MIFIVPKTHTQPKHQKGFSDPSGIMNAYSAQAPLTLRDGYSFQQELRF